MEIRLLAEEDGLRVYRESHGDAVAYRFEMYVGPDGEWDLVEWDRPEIRARVIAVRREKGLSDA